MAVYRRAYRPYDGPLTPERTRFLAVARYALAELSESKVLMGFVVLCMFPFLIEAIGIYVASSGPAAPRNSSHSSCVSPRVTASPENSNTSGVRCLS